MYGLKPVPFTKARTLHGLSFPAASKTPVYRPHEFFAG